MYLITYEKSGRDDDDRPGRSHTSDAVVDDNPVVV